MTKDTIMLLDQHNQQIALGTLWEQKRVLFFFMRQIGCGLCRQQLLTLKKYASQFEAHNTAIAVIIMGDGMMAQGLADLYKLPFPVYADPSMQAYGAFDIGEGTLWDVMNPGIVVRQVGLMIQGMRPMWGAGSFRQLGGLVLVERGGTVIYHHIADPIYKYPPWEDVLAKVA